MRSATTSGLRASTEWLCRIQARAHISDHTVPTRINSDKEVDTTITACQVV
jgi:hypothetical protein